MLRWTFRPLCRDPASAHRLPGLMHRTQWSRPPRWSRRQSAPRSSASRHRSPGHATSCRHRSRARWRGVPGWWIQFARLHLRRWRGDPPRRLSLRRVAHRSAPFRWCLRALRRARGRPRRAQTVHRRRPVVAHRRSKPSLRSGRCPSRLRCLCRSSGWRLSCRGCPVSLLESHHLRPSPGRWRSAHRCRQRRYPECSSGSRHFRSSSGRWRSEHRRWRRRYPESPSGPGHRHRSPGRRLSACRMRRLRFLIPRPRSLHQHPTSERHRWGLRYRARRHSALRPGLWRRRPSSGGDRSGLRIRLWWPLVPLPGQWHQHPPAAWRSWHPRCRSRPFVRYRSSVRCRLLLPPVRRLRRRSVPRIGRDKATAPPRSSQ